jgi:transglutaminase-like putative cysteine protease
MSFRKNGKFRVSTATAVLVTFGWMSAGGNSWAESRAARSNPARALARLADDPRLALSAQDRESLRQAAGSLPQASQTPVRRPVRVPAGPAAGSDPAAEMGRIGAAVALLPKEPSLAQSAAAATDLRQRLDGVHEKALRDFSRTESLLRKAGLPAVIFERHAAARAEYMQKMQAVFGDLDAAGQSRDPRVARAALAEAAELLSSSTDERPSQPLDPARMPFRTAKPLDRKPVLKTPEQLKAGPLAATAASAAVTALAAPLVAPTPADLAASEDVQITPEIQALAASLGNQPLRIYNWVRNNIEFLPTYGSVQGSRLTLEAKRGNAFDTASLLIALLRSAGVPARYVTGTVEIPAAAVRNWVGGAATPRVAQQILGQGGVPNVGLTSGGVVTHIRAEHVWVEAFVDNIPSRGAVHNQGDSWVAMDASFKLHTFTPRSGAFAEFPITAVIDPSDHLFDLDPALGKVTNVDTTQMEDRLVDWASQTHEYIVAHHGLTPTVDQLLGGKAVAAETSAVFPASLPYQVLARGTAVSALPASLRHSVTLTGYNSQFDRAFGNAAFTVRLSLPELNSRRLSLEFEPATQADADTLQAARTSGASSLPVYLVHVMPVIRVDGVERARGTSLTMGSLYAMDVVFQGPDGPTTVPYQIVAGDEIAIGITGNGFPREVLEKRLAAHPVDGPAEYLHQVGLHYWMECDALGEAAAKGHDVHMLRLPSVGVFNSPLSVSYFFGSPRSGVYQGRNMDVRLSLLGAAGESPAKVVEFMKQAGFQGSYLEGAVFDQLKDRAADPRIKGISSVHLIQGAMAQGVPVYRITPANAASVMPLLALSSAVESDISSAVSQGKTALVPERNIDLGPWAGVGYIIQDEATGAGAYMISGGLAGGGLLDCLPDLVPDWELLLQIVLFLIILFLIIAAILSAPVWVPEYAAIVLFFLLLGAMGGTSSSSGSA